MESRIDEIMEVRTQTYEYQMLGLGTSMHINYSRNNNCTCTYHTLSNRAQLVYKAHTKERRHLPTPLSCPQTDGRVDPACWNHLIAATIREALTSTTLMLLPQLPMSLQTARTHETSAGMPMPAIECTQLTPLLNVSVLCSGVRGGQRDIQVDITFLPTLAGYRCCVLTPIRWIVVLWLVRSSK